MTNYAVLVYEDLTTNMLIVITVREDSPFLESNKEVVDSLENNPNFKLVEVITTNDRKVYHKACVKAKLDELISYTKHYEDYFKNTVFVNDEVRKEAFKSYLDYEATLIRKVSLAVEVCMCEGIEVDSELALACYDYRQRELVESVKRVRELKEVIV